MKSLEGLVPKPFPIEALREVVAKALRGKEVPPGLPGFRASELREKLEGF